MAKHFAFALGASFLAFRSASAQGMNVGNRDAILKSAGLVAEDLVALYDGNKEGGIPGRWDKNSDYSYWEGSAFVATLIDYWHLTNDSQYNDLVKEAILYQASNDTFTPFNLMPSYLGNDDQCSWGLAAMQAAEARFPGQEQNEWASIAQKVFDIQKARLDEEDNFCKGGLRWGISASHHGYSWKNSQSNGCLFNLAARLARYTGNSTYSDTAVKIYDWMTQAKLISADNWRVIAGADVKDDCASISELYFSIDGAQVVQGAAFMFNHTNGSDEWRNRVEKLTASVLKDYYPSGLAFEPDCEVHELCTPERLAFKGVTIRSLAVVTQLASFTSETILKALGDTAKAIALGCINGENKRKCQFYWLDLDPGLIIPEDEFSTTGVGEQMNAVSAFSNLLISEAAPPAVAPPPAASQSGTTTSPNGSSQTGGSGSGSGSGSGDPSKEGAGSKLFGTPSLSVVVGGLLASSWLGLHL